MTHKRRNLPQRTQGRSVTRPMEELAQVVLDALDDHAECVTEVRRLCYQVQARSAPTRRLYSTKCHWCGASMLGWNYKSDTCRKPECQRLRRKVRYAG